MTHPYYICDQCKRGFSGPSGPRRVDLRWERKGFWSWVPTFTHWPAHDRIELRLNSSPGGQPMYSTFVFCSMAHKNEWDEQHSGQELSFKEDYVLPKPQSRTPHQVASSSSYLLDEGDVPLGNLPRLPPNLRPMMRSVQQAQFDVLSARQHALILSTFFEASHDTYGFSG